MQAIQEAPTFVDSFLWSDQAKKVLAKLDYLEQGQARENAYIEWLSSALTQKNAGR